MEDFEVTVLDVENKLMMEMLHTAALQSSDGSGSGGGAASLPTTLQSASKQGNFRDIRHGAKCRLSCRMFSLYQDQVVAPIAIRIHS